VTLVRIRVAPSCLLRLQKRWGPSSEAKNKKAAALAPRTTRVSWGYGTSLPPSPPEREGERERERGTESEEEGEREIERESARARERERDCIRIYFMDLGSSASAASTDTSKRDLQTLAKETYRHWQKRPTGSKLRLLIAIHRDHHTDSECSVCMYVCMCTHTHTHTHTHTTHTHTHTHTDVHGRNSDGFRRRVTCYFTSTIQESKNKILSKLPAATSAFLYFSPQKRERSQDTNMLADAPPQNRK